MSVAVHPAQAWRGILLVFLAYFYFLLFSQFTLLHLLPERLGQGAALNAVLGAMAAAGIAGSLLAVRLRAWLRTGAGFAPALAACAAVALAAPHAQGAAVFALLAALMGFALGVLTVAIAALLPALAPRGAAGRVAGIGTGLAYAACNLPPVFAASPGVRALVCAGALAVGALVLARFRLPAEQADSAAPAAGWTPLRLACLVAAFMVLVWFDSAAFYVIQQSRALKGASWEGAGQLWLNAGAHLAAALAAGWLLDNGRGRYVLPAAWAALAAGALGLQWAGLSAFTLAYVAGVSLYSTALVRLPSLCAGAPGDRGSFARAAAVYSLAGWVGSGLGIGMAQNLGGVPSAFVAVSALVLAPAAALSPLLK